jgi:hypothetical protein
MKKFLRLIPLVLVALLVLASSVQAQPSADHLAACEPLGTLLDGRALWAGDCVSAPEPTATATLTETPVPSETPAPSATFLPTVFAPETPAAPQIDHAPYPAAPLCASHSTSAFHTLWNAAGCHYDHEHGESPFTADVAASFPGFDLRAALGGVEVGHQHPTSPVEFAGKHGGWKWQVNLNMPCVGGFEGAVWGVRDAVIGYHAFGPQSVELEARVHSTVMLLNLCDPATGDAGTLFIIEHQDYGQRVAPYQGFVLPYPNTPLPAYLGGLGPYWSVDCFGTALPGCRPSVEYVRDRSLNVSSTVTSKGHRAGTNSGYSDLLWRVRDNYEILDASDMTHPFTWVPLGGRYNNTTTRVHEVGGLLPGTWDADGDGRATDAFPIESGTVVMVGAPVGVRYGADLCPTGAKCSNPDPATNPERDIYFCGGLVCAETDAGAMSSGWIGAEN